MFGNHIFSLSQFPVLDYASLLRPPTGTSGSGSVATGRFFFRKKTLSYSFVTSKEFGLPKLITFLDNEANIIEEFPIQMTSFQVGHLVLINFPFFTVKLGLFLNK